MHRFPKALDPVHPRRVGRLEQHDELWIIFHPLGVGNALISQPKLVQHRIDIRAASTPMPLIIALA